METKVHDVQAEYKIWRSKEHPSMNHEYLECSYCGSLHPTAALELLKKNVRSSGADWKYGWPHKFYIQAAENGRGKFYSKHLHDADGKTFKELSDIIATKLGIRFELDEEKLYYKAPYHGYQTWFGTAFDDDAHKIPENT